jgi:hypothetical protein
MHLEEQKTELAKTITMLEGEITRNTGQLNSTSDLLEKFKTEANVTNMEHATILLQEGLKSLDAQRESLVVQTNYYDNLVKLLRSGDRCQTIQSQSLRHF